MPLREFEKFVAQAEAFTGYKSLLTHAMHTSRLRTAQVLAGWDKSTPVLGEIREQDGALVFFYRSEHFVREYRFNEPVLTEFMHRGNLPEDQATLLSKLRLINTRNRLTWALVQAVLAAQTAYLRSGNTMLLLPLTQSELSAELISSASLATVADPGRISRLIRGLSIQLPNGQTVSLSKLFPRHRQIHCYAVNIVIKKEKTLITRGEISAPLTDEEIATVLAREHDIGVSRRTVANIRRDLGIPGCRSRGSRMNYLIATAGFSAQLPLTQQTLRTGVPTQPGIYEIRMSDFEHGVSGSSEVNAVPPLPVLYIGSSGDLRKRLADHLRGSSGNSLLYRHISNGTVTVRFRLIREDWRTAERNLYDVFCETFGSPPLCNRMSP